MQEALKLKNCIVDDAITYLLSKPKDLIPKTYCANTYFENLFVEGKISEISIKWAIKLVEWIVESFYNLSSSFKGRKSIYHILSKLDSKGLEKGLFI